MSHLDQKDPAEFRSFTPDPKQQNNTFMFPFFVKQQWNHVVESIKNLNCPFITAKVDYSVHPSNPEDVETILDLVIF
jgi:hypothetical protein